MDRRLRRLRDYINSRIAFHERQLAAMHKWRLEGAETVIWTGRGAEEDERAELADAILPQSMEEAVLKKMRRGRLLDPDEHELTEIKKHAAEIGLCRRLLVQVAAEDFSEALDYCAHRLKEIDELPAVFAKLSDELKTVVKMDDDEATAMAEERKELIEFLNWRSQEPLSS